MCFIVLTIFFGLLLFFAITGADDDSSNAESPPYRANETQVHRNDKDVEEGQAHRRHSESHNNQPDDVLYVENSAV